ncbi:hypothetical protein [Alteraurantiacibacter buctensis]|uniref:Uncharacterized protein n=1 Tax=Alteraurantiacibacter buctensis TaxID=1503981 RepID=A0A844YY22_9SPHN|nr:hypothetical protein [Alteraurantiacibacter buctensis]MXO70633.1 hypothetical protein [Alteraurantiacibacter buctensis]
MAALAWLAQPATAQQRDANDPAGMFRDRNAPAAPAATPAPDPLTYADLVSLAQASELVLRVEIRDQRNVPVERAPGLAPGHARLYLQARTQALLAGAGPVGENSAFLTDVPLDARGRRPNLKRGVYLLFANRVPGRPGELVLVGRGAMQVADPLLEQRLRTVLTQLVQSTVPPVIEGVREAISVPGNLAGESETQVFLATQGGQPVSLSVVRRPGMPPAWGVSWSEIVDQSARPPQPETLEWFALACRLPDSLPESAFLQSDPASRTRAREDYAFVRRELGNCARTI